MSILFTRNTIMFPSIVCDANYFFFNSCDFRYAVNLSRSLEELQRYALQLEKRDAVKCVKCGKPAVAEEKESEKKDECKEEPMMLVEQEEEEQQDEAGLTTVPVVE